MKFFLAVLMFGLSGLASGYVYHLNEGDLNINWIYPGLFFTTSVVLVFAFTEKDFKIMNLVLFYGVSLVSYIFIYWLTFLTFWFGFLVGIMTAGLGAIIMFKATDTFLKKITYDRFSVFLSGSLAFIVNDLLMLDPVADFIKPIYQVQGGVGSVFAGVFFFWQITIGYKLYLALEDKFQVSGTTPGT